MAGKQAVIFLLDCSSSMEPYMQQAKRAIAEKASQLLMASKTHEMALVLSGVAAEETANHLNEQDEEQYIGIKEAVRLDKGSGAIIRNLNDVEASDEGKTDLLDAMVVAIGCLGERTLRKKYTRHVYFFTDCASECADFSDLPSIVDMYLNEYCKTALHVIVCGGGGSGNGKSVKDEVPDDENEENEEHHAARVKRDNEKMLRSAAAKVGGSTTSLQEVQEAIAHDVITARPMGTKLMVSLGSKLKLRCVLYKRATKKMPPSLGKESRVSEYSPQEKDSAKVHTERTYHNLDAAADGDSGAGSSGVADVSLSSSEVEFNHQLTAVRYGTQYFPHVQQGSFSMELSEKELSIKILGFVKREAIPFSYFMGEAHLLKGETPAATQALKAFSRALQQEGDMAIVRMLKWVRTNPQPQLACLIPEEDSSTSTSTSTSTLRPINRQGRLIVVQLPYNDDLRDFTFPSFKYAPSTVKPNSEQCQSASRLITAMTLPPPPSDDPLRAGLICNPYLLRYKEALIARLSDEGCVLPQLDEKLKEMVQAPKEMMESSDTQAAVQSFKQAFTFHTVDGSTNKKKRQFWSDLVVATADNPEGLSKAAMAGGSGGSEEGGGGAAAKKAKVEVKVEYLRKIGTQDPLSDFRQMLQQIDKWAEVRKGGEKEEGAAGPPSVADACQLMKETMKVLVEEGGSDAHRRKAVKCCEILRSTCAARKRGNDFNSFMKDDVRAKYKDGPHGAFWDMLVESGVGLISAEEDDSVTVDEEEVRSFFENDEQASNVQATQGVALTVGGIDDDMEDFD